MIRPAYLQNWHILYSRLLGPQDMWVSIFMYIMDLVPKAPPCKDVDSPFSYTMESRHLSNNLFPPVGETDRSNSCRQVWENTVSQHLTNKYMQSLAFSSSSIVICSIFQYFPSSTSPMLPFSAVVFFEEGQLRSACSDPVPRCLFFFEEHKHNQTHINKDNMYSKISSSISDRFQVFLHYSRGSLAFKPLDAYLDRMDTSKTSWFHSMCSM